jgi:hypothetical protein
MRDGFGKTNNKSICRMLPYIEELNVRSNQGRVVGYLLWFVLDPCVVLGHVAHANLFDVSGQAFLGRIGFFLALGRILDK